MVPAPLDADQRKQRIRSRITAGILPGAPATLVSTGWGTGRRCSACDEPINPTDVEIEIEVSDGHPNMRFDRDCFAVWRSECDHA